MKDWPHLTNTTDEMLTTWHKTSALKKLQWLEAMRELYRKAVPKKKRAQLWKLREIKLKKPS